MSRNTRVPRRGFTLIEILIVITVIAIIALIVVPRFAGAIRKSRESSLRAELRRIRMAVSQFQADTGVWPADLDDLVQTADDDVTAEIPGNSYNGPYLTENGGIAGTGVPANPFADATSATLTDHWRYDSADGTVTVPDAYADRTTMDDDTPYSQL
jgi:prepilin-type N-terminal cleavage/methylation domain-containing protein